MKHNLYPHKKRIKKTLLCSLISAALSSAYIQSVSAEISLATHGGSINNITSDSNIGPLSIYGDAVVNILNGASVTATDAVISGTTEKSTPLNIMDGILTINGSAFFNSGTINIKGVNSKLIYQKKVIFFI